MKNLKRGFALVLTLVLLMSTFAICAEAVSVKTTSSNYGYMLFTDTKQTKTVTSVKLYGSYDYLNFYINSKSNDTYFFYEIYSDSKYTKLVDGDYVLCDKGTYTWSPCLTLKDKYKSKTYYCATYAAKIDSNGNVKLSTPSLKKLKITVDRTSSFAKQTTRIVAPVVTADGPQIKWYKHSNAATKYYIYRRSLTGTKWTKIATVGASARSYTDKSVKNKNGNYVYTVKAVNKKGTGSRYPYALGEILYAYAPTVSSATTYDNTVKVSWNKTHSSATYKVYRKEAGGSWKTVKSSTSSTTFYDKTPKNGKTYQYAVRATIPTKYGNATSAYKGSKTFKFVSAPKMSNFTVSENGVQINWTKVSGATAYTIYRKKLDSKDSWTNIAKVANSKSSYIDTTANENSAYTYTVRAEGTGCRGSYSGNGKDFLILKAPENIRFKQYTGDYNYFAGDLYWNSVENANAYDVYYKNNDGKWIYSLTSTDTTAYLDSFPAGKNEFAVVAKYTKSGSSSPVAQTKIEDGAISFVFIPLLSPVATVNSDNITLNWREVSQAEGFNIYRAAYGTNNFELIAENVQDFTYSDTSIEQGVTYNYVVKAIYEGAEQTIELETVIPRAAEAVN